MEHFKELQNDEPKLLKQRNISPKKKKQQQIIDELRLV